jgi:hypothetical protein
MRRTWTPLAVMAACLLSAPAYAQDDDDDDTSVDEGESGDADELDNADSDDADAGDDESSSKDDDEEPEKTGGVNEPGDKSDKWHLLDFMTFGIGIVGQAGANFLDKPGDQTVQGQQFPADSEYPGFAGVTTGVGPKFEVRFLGYVGIELDILFQSDRGTANLDSTTTDASGNVISREEFTIKIGHRATHLPLLFKGALPGKWVTPVVFLGPEFVIVGDAKCEEACTGNPSGTTYGAFSEGYTAFTFGLGLEVNLPVPTADIRIPLSLRGNFNPTGGTRDDRANHVTAGNSLVQEDFSTAWKFQAVGNFGAAWHF